MAKQELSLRGNACRDGRIVRPRVRQTSQLVDAQTGVHLWAERFDRSIDDIWRDRGKTQRACELLAPVYGWFIEGFDTRDLKEAKALLEELAA
jgi:predicted ATPase